MNSVLKNSEILNSMKKKVYIAPECFVIELETEVSLMAVSFEPEDDDDEVITHTNRKRGEWGNLWGEN